MSREANEVRLRHAERLLVGALMIGGPEVAPLVDPNTLADPRLAMMARAALALLASGKDATPIAVAERAGRDDVTAAELVELVAEAHYLGGVAAARSAADTVREHARRRRIVGAARDVMLDAERDTETDTLSAMLTRAIERDTASTMGPRVVSLADAMAAPPVAWLVAGLVPAVGVGFIVGPPNVGKTAIGVDIALRVAHGVDYHGRAIAAGSALYFASEGAKGLGVRAAAWHAAHNAGRLPCGRVFDFVGGLPSLSTAEGIAAVRAQVVRASKAGDPVRLVVVDTLSGHWSESEDKAEHVAPAMAALQRLAAEHALCVLLLHHERKPQEGQRNTRLAALRGSSAWSGSADFVLAVDGKPECVTIECTKQRDAERAPPWTVALRRVDFLAADGSPRCSVVALPAAPADPVPAPDPVADADAMVLHAVDVLREMGGARSKTAITVRMKGRRDARFAALDVALDRGAVVDRGEREAPRFVVGPLPAPAPRTPQDRGERSPGSGDPGPLPTPGDERGAVGSGGERER